MSLYTLNLHGQLVPIDSLLTTTNENIMRGRSYSLMAVNGQIKTIIGHENIG